MSERDLNFTGERYTPQLDSAEISYEHWHRYCFASAFAAGKRVLDLACGEGYGSAWLAQTAESVLGVDISAEAVAHATQRYVRPNLAFAVGSAERIPVDGERVFDLVVSFETIEHVTAEIQAKFLDEVARLLKPDGVFLVSTPNKLFYSDLPNYRNEYHLKEFYVDEFRAFLQRRFPEVRLLGQKIYPVSYLWPLAGEPAALQEYRLAFTGQGFRPTAEEKLDLYTVAVCSRAPVPDPPASVLVDLSERLLRARDRKLGEQQQALAAAETRAAQLESALTGLLGARRGRPAERAVAIVIPVFNQAEATQRCLAALARNTPESLYAGVIVDNASTDETPELLKGLEGDVTVISNRENLGFVHACNQGAAAAESPYLLFLNNDTEPQPGWLEAMVSLLESDPAIGAVGAKLVYPDGHLQEAGGLIFNDGGGWNFGRGDSPDLPAYARVSEVDYCSGACLLVRRDAFQRLGGFDVRYAPAYYEDTDLCFGLRSLGYKVMYCPGAVVVHHEGTTAGTDLSAGMKRYQNLNRGKFCEKWREALRHQEPSPGLTRRVPTTADRRRLLALAAPADGPAPLDPAPNLLVIDPTLPLYDRASGSLRLFQLIKLFLGLGCRVTYIARNGLGHGVYQRELEALGVTVYATDPEKLAALGHRVQAPPIDLLAILGERRYDLAWLSFYHIAEQYLPEIRRYSPATRILVDTVDVHFLRETRQAELAGDEGLRRAADETKRRELAIYRQADGLVTVTPDDRRVLASELPDLPIDVIPNIHAARPEPPSFDLRNGLLFVGNFNHPPNIDAMLHFCAEILPLVRRELPDLTLYIVGDHPPREIKALEDDHILVTGYVAETAFYLNLCKVSVAPLRYGAGMKGKIGEALSYGLPVVTTPVGAEGMGLEDGVQALIAAAPEDFARAVIRLVRDRELWSRLSAAGRALMNERYAPESVARSVRALLAPAAETSPTAAPTAAPAPPACDLASLIVLAHGQLDYTRRCLESLRAQTREPYELIVVDNGSLDGTARYLEQVAAEAWPPACRGVRILRSAVNLGYAGGNNLGLEAARGRYLVLLNNDVVLTPGWLGRLLACARSAPRVGLVGPLSNQVSGAQRVAHPDYDLESLAGLDAYAAALAREQAGRSRPVWRLVGFCLLLTRAVLDRLGGLDPAFGLGNFEDDDYCLRAAAAGFEARIAEDCYVHHFGGRTFAAAGIDYAESLRRNWDVFKRKWSLPAAARPDAPLDLSAIVRGGFQPGYRCPLPGPAAAAGGSGLRTGATASR